MIRRPPRSTLDRSSAASDVYKRQVRADRRDVAPQLRVKEVVWRLSFIHRRTGFITPSVRLVRVVNNLRGGGAQEVRQIAAGCLEGQTVHHQVALFSPTQSRSRHQHQDNDESNQSSSHFEMCS